MKKQLEKSQIQKEVTNNNSGLKIFICILLLALLGIGSFTGFYMYNSLSGTTNKEKVYVSLGDVMVNLADEDGKRYFKGEISVGYDKGDSTAKKQLTDSKQLVVVQDAINFYLQSKTADFVTGGNEEQMKDELIESINNSLQGFKITDIRFASIIVQ